LITEKLLADIIDIDDLFREGQSFRLIVATPVFALERSSE
jgi:hypothetical protein